MSVIDNMVTRLADANARIAELEQQLEMRKEAINAQFRLMERVKELERALREAMEWDWLTDAPPPKEIVDQCNKALGL